MLLLGPLYHLTEASDRATALAEARRIARPGGVVVAVGISRFASLVDVSLLAVKGPGWIVEDPADLDNQLFAARAVESEPALMGATSHIMMIGYRAASD